MGRIIHNIIICQVLFLVVLSSAVPTVICFSTTTTTTTTSTSTLSHLSGGTALFSSNKREELEQEAQDLLAKAQKLRLEIGDDGKQTKTTQQQQQQQQPKLSEWSVDSQEPQQYRLYIDIGREEGTWMDPRWGASGKRIEGTLDLCFSSSKADPSIEDKMVLDNQRGQSSSTYVIETGKKMRLKSGFDSMAVKSGGYRVDFTKNGGTLRFYFQVEGTQNR